MKLPAISDKYLKNQSIEQSFGESIDALNLAEKSRREHLNNEDHQNELEVVADEEETGSKDESFDEEKGNFTIFDH